MFCKNIQMVEYNEANVKLLDSQLKKLRTAVKNQTQITLIMNIKIFNGNQLPRELLFITRQET